MNVFKILRIAAAACCCLAAIGAVAGVEWRGIGDDARHIGGPPLNSLELDGVCVLVVRYNISELRYADFAGVHKRAARFADSPLTIVGSVQSPGASAKEFAERSRKAKEAGEIAALYPQYVGFGIASGEPPMKGSHDFYFVDETGKVVFHTNKGQSITQKLGWLLRDKAYGDRFLGGVEIPAAFSQVKSMLKTGKPTTEAYSFLKRRLKGPDAVGAQALIDALDRSWLLRVSRLQHLAFSKPGLTLIQMDELLKEFPQVKADPRWGVISQTVKNDSEAAAMSKIIEQVEKLRAAGPRSPGEAKRLLAAAKGEQAKLEKLKLGRSEVVSKEASDYEGALLELVVSLEKTAAGK